MPKYKKIHTLFEFFMRNTEELKKKIYAEKENKIKSLNLICRVYDNESF